MGNERTIGGLLADALSAARDAEHIEETAVRDRDAKVAQAEGLAHGADLAQWLDGDQEQLAILEMAREAQKRLRHKPNCNVGACAPGCAMPGPA